jgi:transglutaminase-like putative cysteine protease
MAKANGTDGSLLSSLPWTLAALGFSVGPHVPNMPFWITGALIICGVLRLHIERNRKRLPPTWLRIMLALGCFIGVLATYDNITGVGPGSALLAIMAALKLLETRERRDQFVILFISIFLIMASLLREQYLWSLPYLIVGVVITMTAWLRMSASERTGVRRSLASTSRLLLYAAPLTIAMWVLFPRLSAPFWAIPVDTSRAESGLSDTMSPGDISSLSLSNEVAFRVDFDADVPSPERLYWRGLVLHTFNGRSWNGNAVSAVSRASRAVEYVGEPVAYQITMEPTSQQWVYALDVAYEWSIDKTGMGRQQQLIRDEPIDQRTSFHAVSFPRYRIDPGRTIRTDDHFLLLPPGRNKQTVQLAKEMRAAAADDQRYIDNVMRMFNEEDFFYTLEPPALGSSPVDQFLFETRQGFCEHYASAFAVMMRAAGIPARIVLGYQGGELNPFGNYMIVRQSDAHAWTEVWLVGRGWTRVDPTSAVAPERITSGISGVMWNDIGASWGLNSPSRLLHQLTLTWDALNAKWNDWILGYGPENQNRFLEWLGMEDPDWRQMILTLLAIVVALIAIISLMLVARYRPPKKDEAAVLYAKFTSLAGMNPHIGESPQSYLARLRVEKSELSEDANDITEQYLESRYGLQQPDMLLSLRDSVKRFSSRV